jgi:hypothetical protein
MVLEGASEKLLRLPTQREIQVKNTVAACGVRPLQSIS